MLTFIAELTIPTPLQNLLTVPPVAAVAAVLRQTASVVGTLSNLSPPLARALPLLLVTLDF